MKHIGDITKLKGDKVPPVTVVIGGSPCQDLSIAGLRKGLAGERSSLFMEQIRLIKEMRQADVCRGRTGKDVRPRFMVWENVPGALSSGTPKGGDFQAVLTETIRVVCPQAPAVPIPKNGWPTAGCLSVDADAVGGGCSLAYAILDAQHWGTPQRRRRITLIMDFGGQCAQEILFVRESMQGHNPQERDAWKTTARYAQRRSLRDDRLLAETGGTAGAAYTLKIRSGCEGGKPGQGYPAVIHSVIDGNILDDQGGSQISVRSDGKSPTLRAETHGNLPCVLQPTYCIQGNAIDRADNAGCNGKGWTEDVSYTLNTVDRPAVAQPVVCIQGNMIDRETAQHGKGWIEDVSYTLNTVDRPAVVQEAAGFCTEHSAKSRSIGYEADRSPTLRAGVIPAVALDNHPNDSRVKFAENNMVQTLSGRMGTGGGNVPMVMEENDKVLCGGKATHFTHFHSDGTAPTLVATDWKDPEVIAMREGTPGKKHYIVRRLTPLECERLQGFPDGWTDIGEWKDMSGKTRESKDAPRYKAIGNSIAIPPWFFVLTRLSVCCGTEATMGSLFDGIGGFPLIWETLNGVGSCIWASEIEDFPIAVTERHFSDGPVEEDM